MPRIPLLDSQQRENVTTPVAVGSSGDARLEGETLQRAGQALSQFSGAVDAYSQASDRIKNAQDLAGVTNRLVSAGQQARFNAEKNSVKIDGSDAIDSFKKEYSQKSQEILGSVDNDAISQSAQNASLKVQNQYHGEILSQALQQMPKKAHQVNEDNMRQAQGVIFKDPTQFDQQNQIYQQSLDGQKDLYGSQLPQTKAVAQTEFLKTAIQGFNDKGDFAGAKDLLRQHPDLFANAEQRQQQEDLIDNEKFKTLNRQNSADAHAAAQEARQHAAQSKQVTRTFIQRAALLPGQGPEAREGYVKDADAAFGLGFIEKNQHDAIVAFATGAEKKESDAAVFNITQRMDQPGANYDDVMKELHDSVASGAMDPLKGATLDERLWHRIHSIDSDPAKKASMVEAKRIMNSVFADNMISKLYVGDTMRIKSQAFTEFNDQVFQGKDPRDASIKVVAKYGGTAMSLPYAPGIDVSLQSDLKGINEGAQRAALMRSQDHSPEAETIYRERIKALDARKQVYQSQAFIDSETKKLKEQKK